MNVKQILNLIPQDIFRDLAIETKVDHQVKLLSGELIFKLILFSMLNSDNLSLRVMEQYLGSAPFRSFTGYDITIGKYNSIRDRICSINSDYFENMFERISNIYSKYLKEETAITKLDSTYVSLASKLLIQGLDHGHGDKKYVKFSIGLKGSLPSIAKLYLEQTYVSEDAALAGAINSSQNLAGNIVVFDRGLQSREAFDTFSTEAKLFVCRANPGTRVRKGEENTVPEKPQEASLTVQSDISGYLLNKKQKLTSHRYRIIKGTKDKNGDPICFITNIMDEDAYTIAKIYRQRWDIEVFFKFLKQHLNLKHLVSRTANGIKVMLCVTLILATLIIVYKKLNGIKSYKIAKLKFEMELERNIIKAIVELCGGDPSRAPHLFDTT